MAQAAIETMDRSEAIDRRHLERVTFGDRSLEHEVLRLFDRQAELLIGRMRDGGNGAGAKIGALAHTLKGSAAGIGAGAVAHAAEAAEQAAAGSVAEVGAAVDRLAQAVEEARALIAELLRDRRLAPTDE